MGMKVGGSSGGAISDINVTPLVDVVLVLLVIFMVVSHMLTSGVDVPLPVAKTAFQVQDSGQHLVVSVNDKGSIFVDTRQVTGVFASTKRAIAGPWSTKASRRASSACSSRSLRR